MQYVAELAACVCAPNAIAVPGGCQACAEDEVVSDNQCVCPAGEVKNDVGVCARVPGLGDPCDPSGNTCTDAVYNYCAATSATTGTCTNRCTSDTDCGTTGTCADWEAEPYCRTFSGVGKSCTQQSDCAGLDASSCDTVLSHTCIVAGCTVTGNECPRNQICCDYTSYGFGLLCQAACQ
ncbi:MAG: hypothetical protein K8W52_11780 [Deltaproteobacteria bacterium]|nr:hypothetical protein [Deltaproteobacteria bacterium]